MVFLPAVPAAASGWGAQPDNLFERRGGTMSYLSGVSRMSGEQEQLVFSYMNAYYDSLMNLKVEDARGLYASDAWDEAQYNHALWELLVGIREMQDRDLSLYRYTYSLRIASVTRQSDGTTLVMAFEDSVQCFSSLPDIESRCYDMGQSFTMKETPQGWKLTEHRQGDSMYNTLMNPDSLRQSGASFGDAAGARRDQLLNQARGDVGYRATRGSEANLQADNPYDRLAAINYSLRWIKNRNTSSWPVYDYYGGNCQNFVSQSLYAGGIPMDTTAPGLWKWYGNTPNTSYSATGRSGSWSGCAEFLAYVRSNQGFGLVAQADASYYSGEVGDIIHMGTATEWKHTVIITGIVRDSSGQVVDYLVASNTANLQSFPVSAYYYTNQMLIKVYGWNNA